jgi:predicted nucleotidyltransferase
MRLSKSEQNIIKNTILGFDKDSRIVLFGSRTDDNKKGGDIDLLILSQKLTFDDKLKILNKLYVELGEQKIDLKFSNMIDKISLKIILRTGIYL